MRGMKVWPALGSAFLAAACSTTGGSGSGTPTAQWLVGTWLLIEHYLEFPLACSSGLQIRYDADGTYHLFGENGTWHLQGDRLIETAVESDEEDVQPGHTVVNRIRRAGRNRMLKTFEDGETETFLRCPAGR